MILDFPISMCINHLYNRVGLYCYFFGGLGNLVDRWFVGFVVDYFYVRSYFTPRDLYVFFLILMKLKIQNMIGSHNINIANVLKSMCV